MVNLLKKKRSPFPSQEMTLELYMDPLTMVDQISACGLRHVGYGVPTELFVPLVAAYTDATWRTWRQRRTWEHGDFMVI
jgi:hypothetical protein